MSEWAPRRFWQDAQTVPAEGGHTVTLDDKPVRTPAKARLIVPTQPLAAAIAEEWMAQGERIDPGTMPFTRMANSAIDKVAPQRAEVADMLAAYGDSDLLCYRAEAPDALVARQQEQWDPMLDWAADTLGARLQPRAGVMHAPQPRPALDALAARVHALDAFTLAAFHDLVALSGSLVLGFAAIHRVRPVDELWTLSRLDESWQEEQWGADEEAEEVAGIKREAFLHAARFYRLATGFQPEGRD
ncbi:ATP12 family chaperone protein [Citreimonas salinaria]|uniref:Chaperone required for the assembly of the F1-ATPase n=1 Tax=Citreimonas salinaria TaxID=321339 RepID=A0A1H3KHK0_9RHOB|nr:ATP12 family protein [Citreimonas salinaria]SDY51661.1 Chaperone required for the assembly of the F1-ATPase [Citreimonas salinaria]